jgi:hypothetical protein
MVLGNKIPGTDARLEVPVESLVNDCESGAGSVIQIDKVSIVDTACLSLVGHDALSILMK